MTFTVGHTVNYLNAIDEQGVITKTGVGTIDGIEYHGGIVFETAQDAHDYLVETNRLHVWSIWELDTDWSIGDTVYKRDGEDFFRIVNHTDIIRMITL